MIPFYLPVPFEERIKGAVVCPLPQNLLFFLSPFKEICSLQLTRGFLQRNRVVNLRSSTMKPLSVVLLISAALAVLLTPHRTQAGTLTGTVQVGQKHHLLSASVGLLLPFSPAKAAIIFLVRRRRRRRRRRLQTTRMVRRRRMFVLRRRSISPS